MRTLARGAANGVWVVSESIAGARTSSGLARILAPNTAGNHGNSAGKSALWTI